MTTIQQVIECRLENPTFLFPDFIISKFIHCIIFLSSSIYYKVFKRNSEGKKETNNSPPSFLSIFLKCFVLFTPKVSFLKISSRESGFNIIDIGRISMKITTPQWNSGNIEKNLLAQQFHRIIYK